MARESALAETVSGRYRLLRRLASGGNGEVFVARDQSTHKDVALKRLLSASNQASVVGFMREFHALAALRHPRIIEVYDYGVDNDVAYYTMELLHGHDLGELSQLPFRDACSYLRDVASSLALLHARRLLHRDVSPRNIRRTPDGRCKLIDFGAMTPFGTPPTVLGTPPCLAPEAFNGGVLDQRSDLYSLGAVAYFLLSGRHAYPARELRDLPALWGQSVPPLPTELPPALVGLVLALLHHDPARRPASAAEVIERLSAVAGLAPEDDLAIGRSFLASTPLLGQARERGLVNDALRQTKDGNGRALLITGAAGSGKTRMLNEASLLAQTYGLAVVRVALREQRGVSSGLLRELIRGLKKVVPGANSPAFAADTDLRARAETLRQVEAYVGEIAARQPLLLAFDDVHHGSDDDDALIAALAHCASEHPLSVIASEHSLKGESRFANLSDFVAPLVLQPLDHLQIALLSEALFGDVPNLRYLSEFLYRNAHGNPKLTLELAEHLHARGIVRYAGGSWVLPDEITEPMPRSVAQTLMLRLDSVGAGARDLANLLSVRRRGARIEQLLELVAPLPVTDVLRALEELVSASVLQSAGDEYAFTQDALRAELSRTLPPDVAEQHHLRWANFLLEHASNQDARLEAGWHFVHTAEEVRGAELLAQIAPQMVERRVGMTTAIPALERALQVYERHNIALDVRLHLRALLVMSSYLYDFRLADRYGTETLDLLYPYTGLREAERCARWVGRRAGFGLGIGWAWLKRLTRSSVARGPGVLSALKYYAQSTMGLIGLQALMVGNTQAILDRMRAFEGTPHPVLSLVYAMGKAIHLHGLGRVADATRSIDLAWTHLKRKSIWQITQQEHTDLKIGLLLLEGINESWRERSRTLACADQLEQIDTALANACSLRLRLMYFSLRGDPESAHHYRRLLELKALECGSLWQVQLFAVPIAGFTAGTWHDAIGMRRALERFEQLLTEAPGLAPMRDATLIPYYFWRGDYQAAVTLGEAYMRKFPPMARVGWPIPYAFVANAYSHLGNPARALEICKGALAQVSAADREYFVFYAPLEAAYATALALTGQTEQSSLVFRERIERLRAHGDHQRIIIMHHARMVLARLLGDSEAIQQAISEMRRVAEESANGHAVALAERLSEERSSQFSLPAAEERWTYDSRELPRWSTPEDALRAVCERTASAEGYLYVRHAAGLQLTASRGKNQPPSAHLLRLAELAANDGLRRVSLEPGYLAYGLLGGFVVLRADAGELPEGMLNDLEGLMSVR